MSKQSLLSSQQSNAVPAFTPLGQCGQGSYGRVLMAVTNNYRELPLAIKIVSDFKSQILGLGEARRYGRDRKRYHRLHEQEGLWGFSHIVQLPPYCPCTASSGVFRRDHTRVIGRH